MSDNDWKDWMERAKKLLEEYEKNPTVTHKEIEQGDTQSDVDLHHGIDEDSVSILFEEMVDHIMSEDEFWNWVRDWKDADAIIEETENWNREQKLDDIRTYLSLKQR